MSLNTVLPQLDTLNSHQPAAGHTGEPPPSSSIAGLQKVTHPSPSLCLPGGRNLLQVIDQDDQFTSARASGDVHYPFASCTEWQLAKWLASTALPQSEIDKFLHLDYVSNLFGGVACFHSLLYQV